MLRSIAETSSEFVVVNADDDSLARVGADLAAAGRDVSTFAVAPSLIESAPNGLANVEDLTGVAAGALPVPSVFVSALELQSAQLTIGGEHVRIGLPARGLHYAVDAAGATAMARRLLGDRFRSTAVVAAMASLRTVYGRGETLRVGDEDIEIIMMKNPPSLQLNLDYLAASPEQVFVAVDEGTPDPSWVYDIDLSKLEQVHIVSGTKAWQFATRFAYAGIPVDQVVPELKPALAAFLALPKPSHGTKTMIVNYEQMMLIRKQLGFLDLEGGER
jgi:UDP-N-acetylmuramyl tripeptide synthase